MAAKKKELILSGKIELDLDSRPELPGDKDRLLLAIQTLTVFDDGTYQRAAELRSTAQQRLKTIDDSKLAKAKKTAYASWKSICEVLNDCAAPFTSIVEMADSKMRTWRLAEDAKVAQVTQEIEAANEDVKVDLAEQARLARRNGDIGLARKLEAQIQEIPTDIALPSVKPEVDGLTERRAWKGVVDKPMELIAAVSEGRLALVHTITVRGEVREEPILTINQTVLDFYSRKLEREMGIPGCHAEQDLSFASKGGRG